MTSENKTWQSVKTDYLHQVEKALSLIKHPRKREVLEDVSSHLDRRFAELRPDEQIWENFQAIITEMGPASDYAELLESDTTATAAGTWRKHVLWMILAFSVVVIAATLLILIVFPEVNEADKRTAEEMSSKGWQLWNERKLVEAEDMFKKAIRKDRTNANAWNGLGWSQFNQIKPLNAKVSFEKCLKIQPEHPAALNGLGWIAKEQGKINEAIDYWQRAVTAAPGTTAALHGLATTYMEMEQYDKAVDVYQKWLAVEPNNEQVKADLERAKSRKPIVELSDLPDLIAELSNPKASRFEALNRIIKLGSDAVPMLIEEMKTNYNWQIPKALGAIGDRRAILPLIEKLEKSNYSPMREVVGEALERITGEKFGTSKEKWRMWWQDYQQKMSSQDRAAIETYIVTFKPIALFTPQTARELLDAFNEKHPRGVRTHHFRTEVRDSTLVGCICVDTEAGKDAVISMLEKSEKLEFIETKLATDEDLQKLYKMGQPSLSKSTPSQQTYHRLTESANRKLLDEQTQAELRHHEQLTAGWFKIEQAYEIASENDREKMIEKWIADANGSDFDKMTRAIAALGNVAAKEAVDVLINIGQKPKRGNRPRWMAVRALGRIGDTKAVPLLINLLDHYNSDTRLYAKVTLAEITGVYFGSSKEKWIDWAQQQDIEIKQMDVGKKQATETRNKISKARSP